MSQEKVDRYKEEKKNRQKNLKKEKMKSRIAKAAGALVALVFVGWIVFSAYRGIQANQETKSRTYAVDTAAVDEYLNQMSAEAEEDIDEVEEVDTEDTEVEDEE